MRELIGATRHNLRHLFRLAGRERRGTFWRYVLVLYVAQMALSTLAMLPLMATTFTAGIGSRRGGEAAFGGTFDLMLILVPVSVALALLLLTASVARRLHDSGRSGYWGLLPLPFLGIGLFGFAHLTSGFGRDNPPSDQLFGLLLGNNFLYLAVLGFLIYLLARPGTAGPNRFGPDPREQQASATRSD